MGVCEDCVMVRFEDEELIKEKDRILTSYNKNASTKEVLRPKIPPHAVIPSLTGDLPILIAS